MALDTFCTYLCDEDVNINLHEYDTLLRFNQEMGMPLSRNVILYLRNLVSQ
ncbi:TPA: MafI family immunity protein [Proteus mirabilis]